VKRLISVVFCAFVATAAQAAETGMVVEAFSCNLKAGKTMADLDAATKYFNDQADAAGSLKSYFAAQLVPIRANTPYDVVWVGASPNLNTWASEGEQFQASGAGARTQARFDEVAECESGLFFSSLLHDALPAEEDDNEVVIETYGCVVNPGKTMADVEGAHTAYKAATAAMSAAGVGNFDTVMWTPYLANVPFDIAYLTVHDDMKALAAANSMYFTSKEGMAADAEFAKVMKCKSGLYAAKRVRQPAATE